MSRAYSNYADIIDFTRASSGTALRRVKYGAELVTNGDFSDGTNNWSTTGAASLSNSSGEGLISVSSISPNGAYTDQLSLTVGNIYVFTADVRVGTGSTVGLAVLNSNATSLLVTSETTTSTSNVSLRLVFVCTDQNSRAYIRCTGSVGTYYVDNVSVKEVTFDTSDGDLILFNHPNNTPRIEYDADGNLLGLLVEEARTNLVDHSQNFSAWSANTGIVKGLSSSLSPDGSANAYDITDNGDGDNFLFRNFSIPTTNISYVSSIFVKKTTSDSHYLNLAVNRFGGTAQYLHATFNSNAGVFTAGSGISLAADTFVEDFGNYWRIGYKTTNTGSNTTFQIRVYPAYNDDGGTGRDNAVTGTKVLYGAQLEAGSFPTSYIPTSGSTATRSADVASLSTSAFGYNQSAGTVVVDYRLNAVEPFATSAEFNDGTQNNRYGFVTSNLNQHRFLNVKNSSADVVIVGSSLAKDTQYIVAAAIKENDYVFAEGGSIVGTDSSASTPIVDTLLIGLTGSVYLNGHIKSLKYYPRRLTNAQLQALTS